MASVSKQEDFQDSWVDLESSGNSTGALHSIHNGNSEVEKLLIEAQKESRSPSRANSKESSAQGSPKSPHSPNNELQESRDPGTEWIWDWSSRPEANPPLEWKERFKRPATSVRNTRVMKTMFFSWENLPYIVCSSTIAFISGAAMMFLIMRRLGSNKLSI
ncbi:BCL2/adenovirus E1B 19 kDa protein-interacting protein 3-like [Crassostrea angulata]|uniref:BCL2/adenovirus E1B 19 kDa protein-interacting protein 3 n=2 Tax=Magallana gigas TaxID=29159 RepID=A0A8W8II53_MAGGI|nr:BCL2/adenovirus E1B 19 kDa protein-interacting protein 3 isoform X1 [Crassostrea gigas]XP_052703580.1 BCL2/adenovirus E1B 19 kDa protein-interacting protein 3-like [Crassostrea angulata]|eukprot:XP_011445562.1 PREDICTED: BCL2/adenovirus E1B 19 kDa protein-interacting protein 3 isoform X1 [Crassostrea gigas]